MEAKLNNLDNLKTNKSNLTSKEIIDMDSLISLISSIITETIQENCKLESEKFCKNTVFDNIKIPKISIEDYLKRLVKFAEIESSTLIIICIYIDNINQESLNLTWYNIHR